MLSTSRKNFSRPQIYCVYMYIQCTYVIIMYIIICKVKLTKVYTLYIDVLFYMVKKQKLLYKN